jgi:Protein of unknown function DUF2617
VLTVRPKVAELVFQVFGRALHPELFETYESQTIERNGYRAQVNITSAGHVITWRYEGLTLAEVATAAHHPLPTRRKLMTYRLRDERTDQLECRGGARYQVCFQLETVAPDLFWTLQRALATDERRGDLLHRFESSGRMAMGAVSFIHLEARNHSLKVQALHTFPDDCAVVKTQSLFELPTSQRGLRD